MRVLVANVHAGSLRALNYAQSLGVEDTRAVSFAFDERRGATRFRAEWTSAGLDVAARPERGAVPRHRHAAPRLPPRADRRPDTVVNIVMPEIVVRGWARVLHNQRALYIKRLLLFERHVILSSVPYQLFR